MSEKKKPDPFKNKKQRTPNDDDDFDDDIWDGPDSWGYESASPIEVWERTNEHSPYL